MTERAREESERDWGTHTYISRGLHYIRGANNFALISIPICVPLHIVFIYICPRSLLLLYISFIFYYIFSMHITQDIYIEEEKRRNGADFSSHNESLFSMVVRIKAHVIKALYKSYPPHSPALLYILRAYMLGNLTKIFRPPSPYRRIDIPIHTSTYII